MSPNLAQNAIFNHSEQHPNYIPRSKNTQSSAAFRTGICQGNAPEKIGQMASR